MEATEFKRRYGPAALVTGASSGIGRAFAERLAALGLDLVLVARRMERLGEMAARLADAHGVAVTPLRVDLAAEDAVGTILSGAERHDVGLVVSNAGFGVKGGFADTDAAVMRDMLMVNAHAPLQLAHGFIPRLRARGRGGLLFTSSVEGLIGCPYSTAYSATKALVKSLGEGLWGELTPEGIDVLTICPGATDTEALRGFDKSKFASVMSPESVVEMALDNLRNGPTIVTSPHHEAVFARLTALPRREALASMAVSMKP